jgi:putative glycosyltransferase (TIGR04348 family)
MNTHRVLIISPATATANNGNWQTASRWSRMLSPRFDTSIANAWNGEPFDVMLALHARRSAQSIARWAQAHGALHDARRLGVVLTGTDLYRDIQSDATAQASLRYARQLVVLQERGSEALPPDLRHKTRVIFQSAAAQEVLAKPSAQLRLVMVGHLRNEKFPQTLWDAAHLLRAHKDILIDHIGEALDEELGAQACACMHQCPNYRWLGSMTHAHTLRAIAQSHLLVHTSSMEGGAHVILEAVCSGTPVLASRIPGNIGMLGENYAGYFATGDANALAGLLLDCHAQLNDVKGLYSQLAAQCAQRLPLFSPATEQAAVVALIQDLLHADN